MITTIKNKARRIKNKARRIKNKARRMKNKARRMRYFDEKSYVRALRKILRAFYFKIVVHMS
jgi:glucose-6-phosphate-specific signal transduction histidine kinase